MKSGTKRRTSGSVMSGDGLKKKYRSHPDDAAMKGKPTRTKK